MRPIYNFCFTITDLKVNPNRILKTVGGRMIKKYLLTKVFFKGSVLGFSFWYTVCVNLHYSHQLYCSTQCRAPFFQFQNNYKTT